MYNIIKLSIAASLASSALAYPAIALQASTGAAKSNNQRRVNGISPGFNAAQQYVSNQDEHAYVAPNFAAGDLRGPCPGLNAMANHGYLPHNGIGTFEQYIQATNEVFGMGIDFGTLLSTLGIVLAGDLTKWSMGGPPPASDNALGAIGLLSPPQGISNTHNKYEGDVSPGRGDLYTAGNDYKLQLANFKALYDLQKDAENPNYDLGIMMEHHSNRFDDSIANNPYFFFGPVTGFGVSSAAHFFVYRFMSNKSAENPEGVLNKEVLKSWFGVTGDDDNLAVVPGGERIPDNWYKRAIGDEYTIAFFSQDNIAELLEYPKFVSIGGNTGTVNSFVGLEPENLTDGVFNAKNLAEGDNLMCFILGFAAQIEPDFLKGVFTSLTKPVQMLTDALTNAKSGFNCPGSNFDSSQFNQFPGYSKLNKVTGQY